MAVSLTNFLGWLAATSNNLTGGGRGCISDSALFSQQVRGIIWVSIWMMDCIAINQCLEVMNKTVS